MSDRDFNQALDEIYADIPHYEPSEEELEDQFKAYEKTLKDYEANLDLDYDLG